MDGLHVLALGKATEKNDNQKENNRKVYCFETINDKWDKG